jgi:hypothetical protein
MRVRSAELMAKNFHESFGAAEIKLPSDRSTGLVFAAVALIVAALWRKSEMVLYVSLGIAAVLAVISLAAPILLRPLNILWFRFGMLLHRIVNPLVMFVIFAFVFLPGGLIMRIWHDPLKSRRAPAGASYWVERKGDHASPTSMTNQF